MNDPWDTLARAITRLGDRIDALPGIREATVTATAPLEVTFDTDTHGTRVFGTLVSWLEPGDRVLTLRLARYVWVLGRRGGGPAFITTGPEADDAPSTFGRGVTVSAIDNGNTDGYPAGANLAVLVTVRHNDFRSSQLLIAKTTPRAWLRGVNADGTEWEPFTPIALHGQQGAPFAMAAGTVDIAPDAANTPTGVSVTFPAGRFSQAPFVWASPRTTFPGTAVTGCSAFNETTGGATIYVTRTNTTTTTVRWLAVQMLSDAAAG